VRFGLTSGDCLSAQVIGTSDRQKRCAAGLEKDDGAPALAA
jgi:hypothetical protein